MGDVFWFWVRLLALLLLSLVVGRLCWRALKVPVDAKPGVRVVWMIVTTAGVYLMAELIMLELTTGNWCKAVVNGLGG